jgi:predicted RNase H-like HicB family nuclease
MTYSVTLEHGSDGSYLAWVHELPGCFARGKTREEVEAKLPESVREFRGWLRESGEAAEDDAEIKVNVVERVESLIESSEDTEVLLSPDREPLNASDWAKIERWLSYSRRDLLDEPPDDDELVHVAFVELMYAAWTFDLSGREGLREFLDWTRGVALERMRELADRESGAVTEARWSGAPQPEPWTARKAARRLVWHERLHRP